jgi:hypothetical protein
MPVSTSIADTNFCLFSAASAAATMRRSSFDRASWVTTEPYRSTVMEDVARGRHRNCRWAVARSR